MSVADFGTTLAHLIRVCWSASAGQLHLASIGDSSSPSTCLGEEGAGKKVQLQAGICVEQEDSAVSSKVRVQ